MVAVPVVAVPMLLVAIITSLCISSYGMSTSMTSSQMNEPPHPVDGDECKGGDDTIAPDTMGNAMAPTPLEGKQSSLPTPLYMQLDNYSR